MLTCSFSSLFLFVFGWVYGQLPLGFVFFFLFVGVLLLSGCLCTSVYLCLSVFAVYVSLMCFPASSAAVFFCLLVPNRLDMVHGPFGLFINLKTYLSVSLESLPADAALSGSRVYVHLSSNVHELNATTANNKRKQRQDESTTENSAGGTCKPTKMAIAVEGGYVHHMLLLLLLLQLP